MSAFDEYRQSVSRAREWFSANHASVLASTDIIQRGYRELARCIQVGRDADNHTHVSLLPFVMIMERQSFVALDTIASRQAYQSWLLLRPAVESALIIGKWLDSVDNFTIWRDRLKNPKPYRIEYSGDKLQSKILPRSKDIQRALKTINDLFVHPNPGYYMRHISQHPEPDGIITVNLSFFDDDDFHYASILAMVHLLICIQDSLAIALATKFENIELVPDGYGLLNFERENRSAASKAAKNGLLSQITDDIGLWHLASDA